MTAPRSSLVSQFLPPLFFDLCLHVGERDDLAIAVPACVVRGFYFFSYSFLLPAAFLHLIMRARRKQMSVIFRGTYFSLSFNAPPL
ncbi:hypothetical protein K439DRAFT_861043 [Ramaria rubella]|nr:hypothetical protein K439DRAFT_861043 [Ramaria rubella]